MSVDGDLLTPAGFALLAASTIAADKVVEKEDMVVQALSRGEALVDVLKMRELVERS